MYIKCQNHFISTTYMSEIFLATHCYSCEYYTCRCTFTCLIPIIVIAVLLVTSKCETLPDGEKLNPADEFKILLATDIHLGHKYDNIIRSNDTFNTFDEILGIAKKEKVDFVLLGGDLFDVNEPSIGIMNQAIALLSKAGFLIGWQVSSFMWPTAWWLRAL